MKNKLNKLFGFLCLLICTLLSIWLTACEDENENNEIEKNYYIFGVWTATESWHENSSLNYGGNNFVLTVSYDFQDNNVVQSKTVLKMNGTIMRDSGWIILNATWTANDNVITLSNGKKFVITNEEFNDLWSNPQIVLHFKKVS